MSIADFKDLTESIQAIVVSLGVLLGGAWAVYQFVSLNSITKAKLELETIKKELSIRGKIKAEINFQPFDKKSKSLIVNAKICNIGDRTEILVWEKSVLRVAKFTFGDDLIPVYSESKKYQINKIKGIKVSSNVEPGIENIYPFIVELSSPGTYLIELDIEGSSFEKSKAQKETTEAGLPTYRHSWGTSRYYQLEE